MFNRIKLWPIIKAHLKTLRSINRPVEDTSIYWRDLTTFFVAPLIIAITLYIMKLNLNSQVSNLIAIISIFGGFLFNLLAIIYTYLDKIKTDTTDKVKQIFAKEINANISFCILLSILVVLLLLAYSLIPSSVILFIVCARRYIEFIIYYLLILFFLTLFMVLSRVFVLLQVEGK